MLKTFWANHKFGFRDSSTRVSGRSPALKQYLFDICCFCSWIHLLQGTYEKQGDCDKIRSSYVWVLGLYKHLHTKAKLNKTHTFMNIFQVDERHELTSVSYYVQKWLLSSVENRHPGGKKILRRERELLLKQ